MDVRLVHKTELYSQQKEENLSETRQYVDLAHLYIFDENKENDEQAEIILNNIIKRNASIGTTLQASCELAYYYLLNEKIDDAETVINRAADFMKGPQTNRNKQQYELLIEELEIVKDFTQRWLRPQPKTRKAEK
jgi:hypothetical protein